jgi:hypothetical protein
MRLRRRRGPQAATRPHHSTAVFCVRAETDQACAVCDAGLMWKRMAKVDLRGSASETDVCLPFCAYLAPSTFIARPPTRRPAAIDANFETRLGR